MKYILSIKVLIPYIILISSYFVLKKTNLPTYYGLQSLVVGVYDNIMSCMFYTFVKVTYRNAILIIILVSLYALAIND